MGKKKEDFIRNERIAELAECFAEPAFIQKQSYGISVLETIMKQYNKKQELMQGRRIIDTITSRVKSPESVAGKLERKGYEISYTNAVHRLNDLAGVRVVCTFRDDVYLIEEYLEQRNDITVIKSKDYIKKPKASGYQSIHLIVDVDYPLGIVAEKVRVEVQIRTVAMNYWAKLDHQLCYKQVKEENQETEDIRRELKSYADEIARIDKKMLGLRKRIEAI